MITTKTPRYELLSQSKGLPDGFLEDRRSVYWDNNLAKKDYSKTTVPVLSARQRELTFSKVLHRDYVPDRSSSIWPVSLAARTAPPRPHTTSLAEPKSSHSDYRPPKSALTVVPRSSLRATASARVSQLARHKSYPPLPVMENADWGEWESQIPPEALKAVASSRVEQLASAKKGSPYYAAPKSVHWPIKRATLSAVATDRVKKLSQPKSKYEQHEDYNPKAWQVSPAALHAQASQRIGELSTPLPRKCRTKKI